MKKYLFGLFLLILYAGFPLIRPGFIPTHDGEYHIIRIYEFFIMLKNGYPFPRWAPDLNSGYGVPLFNFQYPFPNYIGSLFHALGFGLVDSFKLATFTGYFAAIYACFLWLRKLFHNRAAFVGSIIFAFVPYWFVDIYVRGSIGEVLSLAWVMISLVASEYKKKILLSVAVGFLIISHNILAMLFAPALALYVLARFRQGILFFVLGILLCSYFWLPALMERSYVVGLNGIDYRDHFSDLSQLLVPSWGTGFSLPGFSADEMSRQIGMISIITVIISTFLLFKERNRPIQMLLSGFLALFVFGFLFMLPLSQPVWSSIAPLQLLQYPWRLLSFVIPISGFCGAYIASKIRLFQFSLGISILAIVLTIQYVRPVTYAVRNDNYYLSRREFTDGTSSLGNSFSTVWAPWIQERAVGKFELIGGYARIHVLSIKPLEYSARISAIKESTIQVNTLYYPGWTVEVDGKKDSARNERGLIQFVIGQGEHSVQVKLRETNFRLVADFLSILSLFCLVGLGILGQDRYAYRHRNIPAHKWP